MQQHFITASLLACLVSPTWAFQVQNGRIYNQQHQDIPIYGVNWSGFETADHVVHGLWARRWQDLIQQIKSAGFTAVRLPVCPGTLKGETPNSIDYSKNPDLKNLNALQILDQVIAEFDRQGIYLLIDHHRPDCQAISNLWYTDSYSEQDWLNDLVMIAQRYQNTPHLLGIDLKNEPHGNVTWGTNEATTDWRLAAQRAATAIMEVNNNVLIFVEGVQDNPVCSSTVSHWWGGNLEPIRCFPTEIPTNRLVWSPHVYGPDVAGQSYFNDASFPQNMTAIWESHFGYLMNEGYAVIIGEFGGKYGHGGKEADKIWQNALVDYLLTKGITNFFYWSWNPNSGDTGGILQDDWTTVWEDKLTLLKRFMKSAETTPVTPSAPPPTSVTSPPVSAPTSPATPQPSSPAAVTGTTLVTQSGCQVTYTVDSQWQEGMVLRFFVHNQNTTPIDGWQVQWTFPQPTQIVNAWNVGFSVSGNTVTVTNESWNKTVHINTSVEFGMQLQGANLQPPTTATLISAACGTTTPPTPTTTTSNTPQNDYQAGYQAGIAHCQQDPLACGIQINPNVTGASSSKTQFRADTKHLSLPKVSILDAQGESYWQAEMEYIDMSQCLLSPTAILFKVTEVKPLVSDDRLSSQLE